MGSVHVIVSFLGAAAVWELLRLIGLLPVEYFPSMPAIGAELVQELARGLAGDLIPETLNSLTTWVLGFALAAALGTTLGLLTGINWVAGATLGPVLRLLRLVPTVALVPVAILVAGVGLEAKLMIVTFAGVWPVLVNAADGVRHIPATYRDNGRVARLSIAAQVREILLPALSPSLFTGLKVSMALTLAVTIGADLLIGSSGLGAQILYYQTLGNLEGAYAGIVWAGVLGTVLNLLLIAVESKLLFWSPEFRRRK